MVDMVREQRVRDKTGEYKYQLKVKETKRSRHSFMFDNIDTSVALSKLYQESCGIEPI
jgi:hypothetical protein